MTLNPYSFSFGNSLSSFYFGGAGSPFQIADISGLEDAPTVRSQDDNRGYDDGMFTGRDFYAGRTITMTINTFAGNGNSAHANYDLLKASLQPQSSGTKTLTFRLSAIESEKQISARVRVRRTTIDPEYTYGFIRSQVSFFCPDPRYFDSTLKSLVFNPTSSVAGRVYPRVYPLSYGGGSLGSGVVNNAGTVYTSPMVTITGPCQSPTLGCVETNSSLTVNVTLAASDVLTLDLGNRIATLNGSPIRNLVQNGSTWFTAAPGNSTFYFNANNIVTGTTVTITYRNAYV